MNRMKHIEVKGEKLFVCEDGCVYKEKKGEGFLKEIETFQGNHQDNRVYKRCLFNGKTFYIHKLVAELYVENPNNFRFVKHLDGNTLNNLSNNLTWVNV